MRGDTAGVRAARHSPRARLPDRHKAGRKKDNKPKDWTLKLSAQKDEVQGI
jgi:hypothetical protein